MSFPAISIFSERSSPSRGRYAAPNTGAPLTAAGPSGAHPEMRGKAASGSRASGTGACGSLVFRLSRRESAPLLRARDSQERDTHSRGQIRHSVKP